MARVKISELNEKTQLDDNDLIPVVDSINNETKKVKYSTLFNNNIAVVTGVITTPEAGSGNLYVSVDINYPTGYTNRNCVVISTMSNVYSDGRKATPITVPDSGALVYGGYGLYTRLGISTIKVEIHKISDTSPSQTVNVEVVLLKIE